jgi:hypothetical protein
MASDTKVLHVVVVGESSSAQRAIKDVGKSAEDTTKKTGGLSSHLGGLKTLISGGLAIEGISKLGEFFGDSIQGAIDAEKATKVLNNQIKNLGPSGQAAFKDAKKFAEDFGASIGVDDDAIKPVEAKLASFPDAFKKGSDGADGMKRSVKAAFDLQAIGIGSASSNIIAIGKAMNDPIKGMTALNKSGVSFSGEQKKQIANYMKQGNLAAAQKILLSGIESNAKGAAVAAASPMTKMKAALDNAGESVASVLLPMLGKLADLITTKIVPRIGQLATMLGPKIAVGLDIAGKALDTLFNALGNPLVQKFIIGIGLIVAGMKIYKGTVAAVKLATEAWAAVQKVLDAEMALNPIGLVVVALTALVLGVIYAWKHFQTFRTIVKDTWAWIKVATKNTVDWFKTWVWPVLKGVFNVIAGAVKVLLAIWRTEFNLIKGVVLAVVNWIRFTAVPFVKNAIEAWKAVIKSLADKVHTVFEAIRSKISSTLGSIKSAFSNAVSAIGGFWSGLKQKALEPVNFVIQTVYDNGIRKFWNVIASKVGAQQLPAIAKLAGGGRGIPSMSNVAGDWVPFYGQAGEYVLNRKQVAQAGGWRGVESVFGPAGRDGASSGHYDNGGIIGGLANAGSWLLGKGTSLIKGSLLMIAQPLISAIRAAIGQIPGTGDIPNLVRGLPTKALDSVLNWLKPKDKAPLGGGTWNGTIAPGAIGAMQRWALQQVGKTYLWSAVGPAHYDCSGMVGNLWALATGNPLYRRYMTTASMGVGRYGMVPGPGAFTIYLNRAGGHTAANVGGLHVEAFGGNGTPNAIGHVGERLSFFNEVLHMPGLAAGGDLATRLTSFMQKGWPEPPPGVVVPKNFKPLQWKGVKKEALFDGGGILPPGTTLAHNRTGRDEYVLRPDQLGGNVTVNVTVQGNVTTEKDLAESIATAVRDALLRKAARNGGRTGLK